MEKYDKPQLTDNEIEQIVEFLRKNPTSSYREIESIFPNAAKWRVMKIKNRFNLQKRSAKPPHNQKEYEKQGMRRCPQCESVKMLSDYYPNNISRCISCEHKRSHPKFKKKQEKDHSCIENLLLLRLREINNSVNYRKCKEKPTVTHNDLLDIFHKQKGLCFYTNRALKLSPNDEDVVSVDRINSDVGYHKDNIVLCTATINMMKRDCSLEKFLLLCHQVSINFDHTVETNSDT